MEKIILFISVLFGLTIQIKAQDRIIKLDGTQLKVKVIEVGIEYVSYKIFDNLNGPANSSQTDHLIPEQIDHHLVWRRF